MVMPVAKRHVQDYTGQFVKFSQMTSSSLLLRPKALTTYWCVSQPPVAASLVALYTMRTKRGVRLL